MAEAVHYNKSSINFLLADSGPSQLAPAETVIKQGKEVWIKPRTIPKANISRRSKKSRKLTRPLSPEFSLKILQQPVHAKVTPRPPSRVFPPFSEHRPIHPPPVLQLSLEGFQPDDSDEVKLTDEYLKTITNLNDERSIERAEELKIVQLLKQNRIPSWTHYSIFFVIARLQTLSDTGEGFQDIKPNDEDLLVGSRVCSGMQLSLRTISPSNSFLSKALPTEKIRSNNFATTFVFSDLAVTKTGKFRLKFDLFESYKGKTSWRSQAFSDTFQVFTPKKFPGSSPSSPLTAFLFKNGARIRQRRRPFMKKDVKQHEETELKPSPSSTIVETSSKSAKSSIDISFQPPQLHHHQSHHSVNTRDQAEFQMPHLPSKRQRLSSSTTASLTNSSENSSGGSFGSSHNVSTANLLPPIESLPSTPTSTHPQPPPIQTSYSFSYGHLPSHVQQQNDMVSYFHHPQLIQQQPQQQPQIQPYPQLVHHPPALPPSQHPSHQLYRQYMVPPSGYGVMMNQPQQTQYDNQQREALLGNSTNLIYQHQQQQHQQHQLHPSVFQQQQHQHQHQHQSPQPPQPQRPKLPSFSDLPGDNLQNRSHRKS